MTNRPAGGFAEVNGTRLAYEVTGSGHPLTLIGVPTGFPSKIPATGLERSRTGLHSTSALLLGRRESLLPEMVRAKLRNKCLPGRVLSHSSRHLTRLSGNFGGKECRDPYSV